MGNIATIRTRRRVSVQRYRELLDAAVAATFGDALVVVGEPTDRGQVIKTGRGVTMCQFWHETRGTFSVDHRHGSVGYMVADALMAHIARAVGGKVYEGATHVGPVDCPTYYMDVVRRWHENLTRMGHPEELSVLEAEAKRSYGHLFVGKFARFWDRPTPAIPIEEEPKPWDLLTIERCCMCRNPTRWWTVLPDRTPGGQVAMCPGCAKTTAPENIPSKREWCDKERALEPRPLWQDPSPWAFQGKV